MMRSIKDYPSALADHSTIHGIKDTVYAPFPLKCFWIIVIILATVVMSMQLWGITSTYWFVDTGTKIRTNELKHFPIISVSLGRWADIGKYKDKNPEIVGHLNESELLQLSQYIDAYFLYGPVFISGMTESERNQLVKELQNYTNLGDLLFAKYNYSLEQLTHAHSPSPEEVFSNLSFPPLNANFTMSSYTSHGGVFYSLQLDNRLESFYVQMSMLVVDVEYSSLPYHETIGMIIGGFNDHAASGRADLILERGNDYSVNIHIHKSIWMNRSDRPCSSRITISDHRYCQMVDLNRDCKGCKWYQPRSTHYPEDTGRGNLCHLVKNRFECLHHVQERNHGNDCLPPCEKVIYEASVLGVQQAVAPGKMRFYIRLANPHLNFVFIEYPLLSLSGYLSSLGGTVSLWFGASVLSVIQVFYLIWYVPCKPQETQVTVVEKRPPRSSVPRMMYWFLPIRYGSCDD